MSTLAPVLNVPPSVVVGLGEAVESSVGQGLLMEELFGPQNGFVGQRSRVSLCTS